MFKGKKIVVVLPAYNAEKTLQKTVDAIPKSLVDEIILVDDASRDNTLLLAKKLGLKFFIHEKNKGYGGNQKTCYQKALALNPDVIVMLHPDYQYDPKLVPQMALPIVEGFADLVLGSRISDGKALKNGMPLYKYLSNRFLTALENLVLNQKLSEYHTGYRAYSARLLRAIPFHLNSDDFVFDTELLVQAVNRGFKISEISVPARYHPENSQIRFWPSVRYGIATLNVLRKYFMQKNGLKRYPFFEPQQSFHGRD